MPNPFEGQHTIKARSQDYFWSIERPHHSIVSVSEFASERTISVLHADEKPTFFTLHHDNVLVKIHVTKTGDVRVEKETL